MSEIVRSIKQSAARKIITRIKHYRPELLVRLDTGHTRGRFRFWQDGGGFDRNYWTASRILEQIDYIHMNPVRRGLVKAPIDWKWSSARFWSLGTESPILINGQFIPAEL
jgi:putative transposase